MRVGIVGDPEITKAWELRLQAHSIVNEVTLVNHSEHLPSLDACVIINPNEDAYQEAAITMRKGIHTFLVTQIPSSKLHVERLYHFAEESRVFLQLAHWSSFSPATQWISSRVNAPRLVQINRKISIDDYHRFDGKFSQYWIDDIAYCLKMIDSHVHRVDVGIIGNVDTGMPQFQAYLKFDNSATASLFIGVGTRRSNYTRFLSNRTTLAEHQVDTHTVHLSQTQRLHTPNIQSKIFNDEEPADRALSLFLKSVQTNSDPVYSIYDCLKLARVVQQIEERLSLPY